MIWSLCLNWFFRRQGARPRSAISLGIWSLDVAVYAGEWVGAAEADVTPFHEDQNLVDCDDCDELFARLEICSNGDSW